MADPIPIDRAFKRDDEPGESGTAFCTKCDYEWQYATTYPHVEPLECPECRRMTGLVKGMYEPSAGTNVFACGCGNERFMVQKDGDVLCPLCGRTHQPFAHHL